jgi:hypothetical protein
LVTDFSGEGKSWGSTTCGLRTKVLSPSLCSTTFSVGGDDAQEHKKIKNKQ